MENRFLQLAIDTDEDLSKIENENLKALNKYSDELFEELNTRPETFFISKIRKRLIEPTPDYQDNHFFIKNFNSSYKYFFERNNECINRKAYNELLFLFKKYRKSIFLEKEKYILNKFKEFIIYCMNKLVLFIRKALKTISMLDVIQDIEKSLKSIKNFNWKTLHTELINEAFCLKLFDKTNNKTKILKETLEIISYFEPIKTTLYTISTLTVKRHINKYFKNIVFEEDMSLNSWTIKDTNLNNEITIGREFIEKYINYNNYEYHPFYLALEVLNKCTSKEKLNENLFDLINSRDESITLIDFKKIDELKKQVEAVLELIGPPSIDGGSFITYYPQESTNVYNRRPAVLTVSSVVNITSSGIDSITTTENRQLDFEYDTS